MTTTARHISVPRMEADPATRAEIIASARKMLDWLEAHPRIPLWAFGMEVQWGAGTRDGVNRLAAQMGVEAVHTTASHRAIKRFGRAAYIAYAPNLDVAP